MSSHAIPSPTTHLPARRKVVRWAGAATFAGLGATLLLPAGPASAALHPSAVSAVRAPAPPRNIGTANFAAIGDVQRAFAPDGAEFVEIHAEGGGGGGGYQTSVLLTPGGKGADITGFAPVTPGEEVDAWVGGMGDPGSVVKAQGGWGNGADGGNGANNDGCAGYSGAGGGATTVLIGGTSVAVAGGGGGAGSGVRPCDYDSKSDTQAGYGGNAGLTAGDGQQGDFNTYGCQNDNQCGAPGGVGGGSAGPTGENGIPGSENFDDQLGGQGGAGGGGVSGGGHGGTYNEEEIVGGGGGGGAGSSMADPSSLWSSSIGTTSAPRAGLVTLTWISGITLGSMPAETSVGSGGSIPFSTDALGPYGKDLGSITSLVTLSSADPRDTVNGGTVTFVGAGIHYVTTTLNSDPSVSVVTPITVEPNLPVTMTVTPSVTSAGPGGQVNFTVTGYDAGGDQTGDINGFVTDVTSSVQRDHPNVAGRFVTLADVPPELGAHVITVTDSDPGFWTLQASFTVTGTSDFALHAPVIASSSLEEGPTWSTSNLTDGQTTSIPGNQGYSSSLAQANPDSTEWVQVDLGVPQPVTSVTLYPRTAIPGEPAGTTGANFPSAFTIGVSDDGVHFFQEGSFTNQNADNGAPATYHLTKLSLARYVRITATELGRSAPDDPFGGHQLQLAELGVYQIDPGLGSTPPGHHHHHHHHNYPRR